MSRNTRNACRVPFAGGRNRSTSSLIAKSPTRSLLATALNAIRAATSAATARFVCRWVPNRWLPLTSTARSTVNSRSSTKRLMNGAPMRAVTFQSMVRTSSPGWYSRTSSNDRPVPLKTEWYSPPSRVCTARRARSCRRRICRITSAGRIRLLDGNGSRNRLDLWEHLHAQLARRNSVGVIALHLGVREGNRPRRREDNFHFHAPFPVLSERANVAWDDPTAINMLSAADDD